MDLLPSAQLDIVAELLDNYDPPQRRRKLSNRDAFSRLYFVILTGITWKYVPTTYCSASAVYKRFQSWVQRGVIQKVWVALLKRYAELKMSDNPGWFRDLFIDSTLIKNIGGRECTGRNPCDRGRMGSKLSVICDSDQVALGCVLLPANKADCSVVPETLTAVSCVLQEDGRRRSVLIGDKAYGSAAIEEFLKTKKMRLVAESRRNARVQRRITRGDRRKLKDRHVIENLFCRMKQFKRIRQRFDANKSSYEGMIHASFCVLLLGKIQS